MNNENHTQKILKSGKIKENKKKHSRLTPKNTAKQDSEEVQTRPILSDEVTHQWKRPSVASLPFGGGNNLVSLFISRATDLNFRLARLKF